MKFFLKSTFFFTSVLTFFTDVYCECQFPNRNLPAAELKAYQKLKPLLNKRFIVEDPSHGYNYYVGICTDALAGGVGMDSKEGVVQIKKNVVNTPKTIIGRYSSSDIMSGSNWVYLEYGGGDKYNEHCQRHQRKAVILFTCDPHASDSSPGMRLLEEERNVTSGCYYLFELAHPEVCENSSSSSVSIGSIILIVFFCVASVYLIAGGLYQRFVLGAKGIEQIPNYEFWKDFGNLQADGCDFVCRSRDARHSSPYKGLGDDQLDEPEERDDNLLPM